MYSRPWPLFVALGLFLFPLIPHAQAADVSLAASSWSVYTGTGALASATDTVPGVGSTTVLNAQSTGGTSFGFIQANYEALNQPGRFVRAQVKSAGRFILYVRARATDGKDYYLTYSSYTQVASAAANGYLNLTLSAEYPARYNQYQTYTLDVQRDLERLVPGVTLTYIRWIAARGPMAIGSLAILTMVDYLAADDDGDLLTGAEEDALGTSPFLFDTDGDGFADGLEAGNTCGNPLDAAVPATPDADPDGDGLTTRLELYLRSDCATAGTARLQATHGWAPYFPSAALPAGASLAAGGDGSLAVQHAAASAFGFGVWNPDPNGPFRLPVDLQAARDRIRFGVRSAEPFYLYVRVLASNGQNYYVAYSSGPGSPSFGGGYAAVPLGGLGYAFGPGAYTDVVRNLSQDLAAFVPGVTVSKVRWLALRGRGAFKPLEFLTAAPAAPVVSGVAPYAVTGGTLVTLAGVRFGTSQGTVAVGGRDAAVVAWSDTSVAFLLPAAAAPGAGPVVLTSAGGEAANFVLVDVAPTLAPGASATGAYVAAPVGTVTLTGANLGATKIAGSAVLVDGVPAATLTWSATAVRFVVPAGLTGVHGVQVTAAGRATAQRTLDVRPGAAPTVLVAEPDEVLDLVGSGYGSSPGTLRVGSAVATVLTWSDTRLSFTVPALSPATYAVEVDAGSVRATVAALEVLPRKPIIDAVSPTVPVIGEVMTLTGRHFGAAPGAVWVALSQATVVEWSDTRITAVTPAVRGSWNMLAVVAPGRSDLVVGRTYASNPIDGAALRDSFAVFPTGSISGLAVALSFDDPVTQSVYALGDFSGIELASPAYPAPVFGYFDRSAPLPPTASFAAFAGDPVRGNWSISIPGGATAGVRLRSARFFFRGSQARGVQSETQWRQFGPQILQAGPMLDPAYIQVAGHGFTNDWTPGSAAIEGYVDGVPVSGWASSTNEASLRVGFPLGEGLHTVQVVLDGAPGNAFVFAVSRGPYIVAAAPTPVTGGTPLAVDGINFGATPDRLMLGGIPAPVATWGDAHIAARAPADVTAGTRMLRVALGAGAPQGPLDFSAPGLPAAPDPFGTAVAAIEVSGMHGALSGVEITTGIESASFDTLRLAIFHDGRSAVLQSEASQDPNTTWATLTTPLEPLSNLYGGDPNGAWYLSVYDTWGMFSPTITGFALRLRSGPDVRETFAAPGLPMAAYDGGRTESSLPVPRGGTVGPVTVTVALTHDGNFMDEIGLTLVAPDGTPVVLHASGGDVGSSALATTYPTLTVPDEPLAVLAGKPREGTWKLVLDDPNYGDGGATLIGFSLTLPGTGTGDLVSNEYPLIVKPAVWGVAPAAAYAGELVTLTGGNFGAAADAGTVTIGGALAMVESWGMRFVRVYVPAGLAPGPHAVVVTAAGQASAPAALTVLP
jgi:subtilisin-like proprotein convertase family protein